MYSKIACGLALTVGVAHGAHYLVRRDGDHGHAPASSYSAAAPASSYAEPEAPYSPPATGYGAPDYDDAPSYGATSYGEPESPFDISTLIIPLLIIFGLSLLFPTTTTVEVDPAARRKRSASKKHTLYKKIL